MADNDNDIVNRLILEGVEEVQAKLAVLGKSGSRSLEELRLAAGAVDPALSKIPQAANAAGTSVGSMVNIFLGAGGRAREAGQGFREVEGGMHRVREAGHVLHPVLEEAGLRFGLFTGLLRASTAGMLGLAAAATGVGAVALAKLGDEAILTRRKLDSLFQNKGQGGAAFEALDEAAKKLHTDVGNLEGAYKSLFEATRQAGVIVNPYAEQGKSILATIPTLKQFTDALKVLYEEQRLGGKASEEATKGYQEFVDKVSKAHRLTTEAVVGLGDRAGNDLARALGKGNIAELTKELDGGLNISLLRVVQLLAQMAPATQKAFDKDAPRDFGSALSESLADINNKFKELADADFTTAMAGRVKDLTKSFLDFVDGLNVVKGTLVDVGKAVESAFPASVVSAFEAALKRIPAALNLINPFKPLIDLKESITQFVAKANADKQLQAAKTELREKLGAEAAAAVSAPGAPAAPAPAAPEYASPAYTRITTGVPPETRITTGAPPAGPPPREAAAPALSIGTPFDKGAEAAGEKAQSLADVLEAAGKRIYSVLDSIIGLSPAAPTAPASGGTPEHATQGVGPHGDKIGSQLLDEAGSAWQSFIGIVKSTIDTLINDTSKAEGTQPQEHASGGLVGFKSGGGVGGVPIGGIGGRAAFTSSLLRFADGGIIGGRGQAAAHVSTAAPSGGESPEGGLVGDIPRFSRGGAAAGDTPSSSQRREHSSVSRAERSSFVTSLLRFAEGGAVPGADAPAADERSSRENSGVSESVSGGSIDASPPQAGLRDLPLFRSGGAVASAPSPSRSSERHFNVTERHAFVSSLLRFAEGGAIGGTGIATPSPPTSLPAMAGEVPVLADTPARAGGGVVGDPGRSAPGERVSVREQSSFVSSLLRFADGGSVGYAGTPVGGRADGSDNVGGAPARAERPGDIPGYSRGDTVGPVASVSESQHGGRLSSTVFAERSSLVSSLVRFTEGGSVGSKGQGTEATPQQTDASGNAGPIPLSSAAAGGFTEGGRVADLPALGSGGIVNRITSSERTSFLAPILRLAQGGTVGGGAEKRAEGGGTTAGVSLGGRTDAAHEQAAGGSANQKPAAEVTSVPSAAVGVAASEGAAGPQPVQKPTEQQRSGDLPKFSVGGISTGEASSDRPPSRLSFAVTGFERPTFISSLVHFAEGGTVGGRAAPAGERGGDGSAGTRSVIERSSLVSSLLRFADGGSVGGADAPPEERVSGGIVGDRMGGSPAQRTAPDIIVRPSFVSSLVRFAEGGSVGSDTGNAAGSVPSTASSPLSTPAVGEAPTLGGEGSAGILPGFSAGGVVIRLTGSERPSFVASLLRFAEGGSVAEKNKDPRAEARNKLTLDFLTSEEVSANEKVNTVISAGGAVSDLLPLTDGYPVRMLNSDGSYSEFKASGTKHKDATGKDSGSSGSGSSVADAISASDSWWSRAMRFADGGAVRGGHILARVSRGEFFMGPAAVNRIGVGMLSAINEGRKLAVGGLIEGPGTKTSDSILAWLSRGGFVLRASAVDRVGVGALSALNEGRGFSLGGFVDVANALSPLPPPGFATGGAVGGSLGHYTVDLRTDKGTITGLQAPEAVAKSLNRYAVDKNMVRTAPSPSWRR